MASGEAIDPYFSVIVPAYNNVTGLRRCLASVAKQSFVDFEVCVVDDGSSVDISGLVAEFEDPRFQYLWQENSGGPARPRNTGIDHSKGAWICFLDHDDIWHPSKLEDVFSAASSDATVDMVVHDEFVLNDNFEVQDIIGTGTLQAGFSEEMLYLGNRFSTSAVSIRRRFLDDHALRFSEDLEIATAEDFDLWLRVCRSGPRIISINKTLGAYFAGTGASSQIGKHLEARHAVVLRHSVDHDTGETWSKVKRRRVQAGMHLDRASISYSRGFKARAIRHLLTSLALSPTVFRRRAFQAHNRRTEQTFAGGGPLSWSA